MTCTQVVPWGPNPMLRGYATLCRHGAHRQRRHWALLRQHCNELIFAACAQHRDLDAKIAMLRRRIAAQQRGIPLTELQEDDPGPLVTGQTEEVRLAHEFLLKKAWRLVRSLAHPDKGGNREEFQTLKDAYEAGDLRALNEYVVSMNQTVMEQIEYWLNEQQRPQIDWLIFQKMPMFQIVKAKKAGNEDLASRLARRMMEERVLELELEILRNHGTKP